MSNHRADEKRFLDERGSGSPLAPNGLNPATIMEKPVRERIIDSYYWKASMFAVNECDIINRVTASPKIFIAGTYGDAQKPSAFLCLTFKLLQLQPSDDIVRLYLGEGGKKFKYLRCLAAFYVRLTYKAKDVYELLEPLLEDRSKLRRKTKQGRLELTYVDEFVDGLLTKDRMCSTTLWKMPARSVLEDMDLLGPRVSSLGDVEALLESGDEDGIEEVDGRGRESNSEREESRDAEMGGD